MEVLIIVSIALFDTLGALEVAAWYKAFLKLKLAARPLPLLINSELKLVLLLLDKLLGDLLFLLALGLESLMFLKRLDMVYRPVIIQLHQAIIY